MGNGAIIPNTLRQLAGLPQATGKPGPAGTPGTDGTVTFYLNVDPTVEGQDGDYAINMTAGTIWENTAGVWGLIGTLPGGAPTRASVSAAIVVAVADINDPSAELALLAGTTEGDLLIATQTALDRTYTTIYQWNISGTPDTPWVVQGDGGTWIAIAGRWCDEPQYVSVAALGSSMSPFTVDFTHNTVVSYTLTSDEIVGNPPAGGLVHGQTYVLILTQDGTGGHTILSWDTDWSFTPAGATPVINPAPNTATIVVAVYDDTSGKLCVVPQAYNRAVVTLVDGANIATDATLANTFQVTLAGNRQLDNPTGLVDGATYQWIIRQDGSGGHTLSYDTIWTWPGGVAPTVDAAADAVSIISAVYDGTAAKLRAVAQTGFA